ncbi:MAG: hypothetical protein MI743_19455, partial [Sneathiellales bacterium]|nr:hypothetical protein [Sneathiellales bacterium]
AVTAEDTADKLYLPYGTARQDGQKLRGEGWTTLSGLCAEKDMENEARRLGCSHVYSNNTVKKIT